MAWDIGILEAIVKAAPASVERSTGEDDMPRVVVDGAPLVREEGVLRLELLLSSVAAVEAMTKAHRISWQKIPCKQETREIWRKLNQRIVCITYKGIYRV
jgi:hypothetical protein